MSGADRDHPSTRDAGGPTDSSAERRGGRRRTYNRRSDDHDPSPPYFEIFERIALALEHIEVSLTRGRVTLPDASTRAPADKA